MAALGLSTMVEVEKEIALQTNEQIYRRWLDELWNKHNVVIIDELFAEDGVSHYPYFIAGDKPINGREELKKFVALAAEKALFIGAEIEEITSSGDTVIALCKVKAKLVAMSPEDPDEHGVVDLKCLCKIRFRDGKIIEHWNNIQLVNKDERLEILEFHD